MAENTVQPDLGIIQLCARLAKFAYTSGNPGSILSLRQNNDEAAKRALLREFRAPDIAFGDIADFQRYYSYSHFMQKGRQPKWFRSYAYLCHIKGRADTRIESKEEGSAVRKREAVDRIVVGFRGTWNDSSASGEWLKENGAENVSRRCLFPKMFSWIKHKLTPSSKYGLSDFYYDGMLIRIPYREGTIWKWYAYWGSLVLERTAWAPRFFTWPRTVAKDWMTRPNTKPDKSNGGHVHLGFWSLWASPEGFAGYDREGKVSSTNSVITSIRKALKAADGRKTDVYVVGHSLGGAVSSFAALEIAKELKEHPNATMYHVTFGSPPVGTPAFATYFSSQLGRHQSWRVSHERDLVAQCFSWCASKWYLKGLNWWTDWSCVGHEVRIRKLIHPDAAIAIDGSREIGIFGKLKFSLAGFGGLLTLFVLSVLAVPVSAATYIRWWGYYSDKRIQQANEEDPGYSYKYGNLRIVRPDVGLEYHSLQRYIELIEDEDDLKISMDRERSEPAWIISGR